LEAVRDIQVDSINVADFLGAELKVQLSDIKKY